MPLQFDSHAFNTALKDRQLTVDSLLDRMKPPVQLLRGWPTERIEEHDRPRLRAWTLGKKGVAAQDLILLCSVFGCHYYDLLERDSENSSPADEVPSP